MMAACLLAWGIGVASADSLYTTGGSVLVGTITRLADGVVKIKTEFAELTVPQDKVAAFATDDERMLSLHDGTVLTGTVTTRDGKTTVETGTGGRALQPSEVTAVWNKGEMDPAVEALRTKVKLEAYTDIVGRTGSKEELATGAGLAVSLLRPADRLRLFVDGAYAKGNGGDTVNQLSGGFDYEYDMDKKEALYLRTLFEHDELLDLNLRTMAAGGYGHYFMREKTQELRGRVGVFFRREEYAVSGSNDSFGIDFGLHHKYELPGRLRLLNEVTYTPGFDDLGEYRVTHITSLELPLAGAEVWKLRLGIANDFTGRTAAGNEKLDTTYFVHLLANWALRQ